MLLHNNKATRIQTVVIKSLGRNVMLQRISGLYMHALRRTFGKSCEQKTADRGWLPILIPILALASCGTVSTPLGNVQQGQIVGGATKQVANAQPVGGFLPNPGLLQPGNSGDPDLVYRSSTAILSNYRRVMLEPVTVWAGPDSSFNNLTPAQRQILVNKFHWDLRQALANHCVLTNVASPGTIQLRFALVDATAPNPVLNTVATYTPYASSAYDAASFLLNNGVGYFAGSATAEGYATDAATGALIWEAVDKRAGTTSMAENTLNTKLDIEHAFQDWSAKLASRLQQLGICQR